MRQSKINKAIQASKQTNPSKTGLKIVSSPRNIPAIEQYPDVVNFLPNRGRRLPDTEIPDFWNIPFPGIRIWGSEGPTVIDSIDKPDLQPCRQFSNHRPKKRK